MNPGDIVADRFRIAREAGRGGMGIVYLARDLQTAGAVALKILNRAEDADGRFALEGRVLSELRHPCIVPYVAHGTTPAGDRYLAMQWLDGQDLGARLRNPPLGLVEAMAVMTRLTDALAYAHARGIVHRDIKPSNVFLVGKNAADVRLLDFGVARIESKTRAPTATGHAIGTPGYMAPEQIRGERVDARADVFSLGCVAFECLAGKPAFVANHALAVLLKIMLEDAPRVREVEPSVPEALDDLISRMLAKDRNVRPADAAAVLRELAAIPTDRVDSAAIAARTPSGAHAVITEAERRLVSIVIAGEPDAWDAQAGAPSPYAESTLGTHSAVRESLGLRVPFDLRDTVLDGAALSNSARPFGARVELLASGAVVMTLIGEGNATDQAARAARCALALRASLPQVPMALATGRRDLSGQAPMDEAIERAAHLLDRERDRPAESRIARPGITARPRVAPIRIDDVTAALLDARFEVAGADDDRELHGERDPFTRTRTFLGRPAPFIGRDRE
ncbi:MAG TPA: serine/threonine-protein kinase, partial [Polyangiaceae bacterium]|nr:serine/threonine-protein kinase [Polyangiaceae bacterium]